MARARLWAAILTIASLASWLVVGQGPVRTAEGAESRASVQLLIDGRVVATFQEVSGLGLERTAVEAVCRTDGRDDDCDGLTTESWQAQVLTTLWQLRGAADELERSVWASSRGRHDTVKNAIGNIRGRIIQTEEDLQNSAQSLKTRHDTVKNAIGNIRAAVRAVSATMTDEDGGSQAELKAMQSAVDTLRGLADGYRHVYRPGRPVYGNITLKGATGSLGDPGLLEWFKEGGGRKSGSIILLDQSGKEAARYNFFEAWPVHVASSLLTEEIELAVERVERTK